MAADSTDDAVDEAVVATDEADEADEQADNRDVVDCERTADAEIGAGAVVGVIARGDAEAIDATAAPAATADAEMW